MVLDAAKTGQASPPTATGQSAPEGITWLVVVWPLAPRAAALAHQLQPKLVGVLKECPTEVSKGVMGV